MLSLTLLLTTCISLADWQHTVTEAAYQKIAGVALFEAWLSAGSVWSPEKGNVIPVNVVCS
jgi:hypothetical protein